MSSHEVSVEYLSARASILTLTSPPKQPVRGLKKVEGGVGLGVGWGMGDGVGGFCVLSRVSEK